MAVGELWETHITRYDRLSLVNERPESLPLIKTIGYRPSIALIMPGSVVSRAIPVVLPGINSATDLADHRFAMAGKMASFKVHPSPP